MTHGDKCLEAAIASLQRLAQYDAWLSKGVYFTTEDYIDHVADNKAALQKAEAERDAVLAVTKLTKSEGRGLITVGEELIRLNAELDALRDACREMRKCRALNSSAEYDIHLNKIDALLEGAP